jgi:hypothetical protein
MQPRQPPQFVSPGASDAPPPPAAPRQFTDDGKSPKFKVVASVVHAALHVAAALGAVFAGNLLAPRLCSAAFGFQLQPSVENHPLSGGRDAGEGAVLRLTAMLLTFSIGGLAVGGIMAVYLWTAITCFGAHMTEAFSAIKCQDYKNFLRLHIAADGALTVYPFGIDRVPKKWVHDKRDGAEHLYRPAPGQPELGWRLIERPFTLNGPQRGRAAGGGGGTAEDVIQPVEDGQPGGGCKRA